MRTVLINEPGLVCCYYRVVLILISSTNCFPGTHVNTIKLDSILTMVLLTKIKWPHVQQCAGNILGSLVLHLCTKTVYHIVQNFDGKF